MYIYRSMADGIPREHEEALDENMRVIEVEGKPTAVLGIRYKAATDAPPPIGIARTASGKLADTGPQIDELEQQEYWADRPGGICGGTRLTSTFREELVVSLDASSQHSYHLYPLVVSVSRVVCGRMLSKLLGVQENKQEISSVWNMFKNDPLAPAAAYWQTYGMPGIGLFLEGYVVRCLIYAVRQLLGITSPHELDVVSQKSLFHLLSACALLSSQAVCNQPLDLTVLGSCVVLAADLFHK